MAAEVEAEVEAAEAEVEAAEAEVEAAEAEVEAEAVGNDGKKMVMAGKRQQQQQYMDGDGDDSLERMVNEEVSVVL
jgi:hypothetical protein